MCDKANAMSALELRKRGELLVKLGYAIAAGVFSALIGQTGYEAIVSGKMNDFYFIFMIACVILTYYTVKIGIAYQERANKLEKDAGEISNSSNTMQVPTLPDEKLIVVEVVNSVTKINIRIEKI